MRPEEYKETSIGEKYLRVEHPSKPDLEGTG